MAEVLKDSFRRSLHRRRVEPLCSVKVFDNECTRRSVIADVVAYFAATRDIGSRS